MQHSLDLHLSSLLPVENDTTSRAFCGPTAIAAICGKPISVVRDACRMARYGDDWPARCARAPKVMGMTRNQVTAALRTLGIVGNWQVVRGSPTLAAWLDARPQSQFRSVCVVNVTNHVVAVAGEMFVDTFTKGQVVHIDEAPRRRKRVQHVFVVTGRVPASPVVSKVPAQKKARSELSRAYGIFRKTARRVGATWKKNDDELAIFLPDGRSLYVTHSLPEADWINAEDHLEAFLATPEPDLDRFESLDDEGKAWGSLYV